MVCCWWCVLFCFVFSPTERKFHPGEAGLFCVVHSLGSYFQTFYPFEVYIE